MPFKQRLLKAQPSTVLMTRTKTTNVPTLDAFEEKKKRERERHGVTAACTKDSSKILHRQATWARVRVL